MYKTSLILAAGDGKRMKSDTPKVLHKVCGYPIVKHVFNAVKEVSDDEPIIITGKCGDVIRDLFKENARYAEQTERRGTAHAVMCGSGYLEGKTGYVTVTAGDMPLLTADTFKNLVSFAEENNLAACVLTAVVENSFGYGRIIRDGNGCVKAIVEQRDATEEEKEIKEINTSVYCFKTDLLLDALGKINDNNAQGELYLTDVLGILYAKGEKIGAYAVEDVTEAMGINDRVQLAQAEKVMRKRINERIMRDGVTLIDPEATYIEADVTVGKDTVIYPGNVLSSGTVIGENCVLYSNNRIENAQIGDGSEVQSSVVLSSKVGSNAHVGPNAYIRPGCDIGNNTRIGDFVELKNAFIGNGTKVSHLTYVGDATVGENCNMGCGTVFVNYDGTNKHHTNVGNHVFIGCNANLIAPLEIGDNAFIAAGSTVTEKVEENDMCIARSRQTNKKGWVLTYKNWK